ncbi:hypothetical protein [Desulfobacula sp.]
MDLNCFCFFISGEAKEVFPGSLLWERPLSGENPLSLSGIHSEQTTKDTRITIGDYLVASARFLSKNDFLILKSGLNIVSNICVQTNQISNIAIFLEKHGAFYHPLKIQVVFHGNCTGSFVLNGAVSKPGLSLIGNEYQLIASLNKSHSKSYLPKAFGVDFIKTDKGRIGFFLGEWFEGFKEFHVTKDQGEKQIVIWESDGTCHYISQTSALPIYKEISRILTYYYDIETFKQIFSWHHAAGDFIVRPEQGKIHVRLITIRGYGCLTPFHIEEKDKKVHILPALLFFFLTLTLRMRLDRFNGTGKTAILGKQVLNSTIEGFLFALDEKSSAYDFGDLRSGFIEFFQQFNLEQIIDLLENLLESCHPDSSETTVIKANIESHGQFLYSIFKNS